MSYLPPDQAEWAHLTHEQLYSQIHTGPGSSAALAAQELWAGAGEVLEAGHARITSALAGSGEGWTGTAADAARSGLGPLTDWALAAVDDARATVSAVVAQGDHAERLRTLMPPPNTADVQAAQAAVAATPPRFGPGLQAGRLASAQAEARSLSDDAFRLMRDYADRSDHNVVGLDRWSVPPAVTVDAAPIGPAAAGSPVRASPVGRVFTPVTATGGGARGVVDQNRTVLAAGADVAGAAPAAAALLPGYGGRGGRPATSVQGAGAAAPTTVAGSLPLGGGTAASRPGAAWLDEPAVGRSGNRTGVGELPATTRPGVIGSDTAGGGTASGARWPGSLSSDDGAGTVTRRPTTPGYGTPGYGTPGYEGVAGRGQGALGSGGEPDSTTRWQGVPGSGGESGSPTRWQGVPGSGGETGSPTRWQGVLGSGGETGPTTRWPGASGSSGSEPGSVTRWSAEPGTAPGEHLGTNPGPATAGRSGTGGGLYPPMMGGGAGGQDAAHRRPDWLVDDSGAFEDHRWFPPSVIHPDDPLPPASRR